MWRRILNDVLFYTVLAVCLYLLIHYGKAAL